MKTAWLQKLWRNLAGGLSPATRVSEKPVMVDPGEAEAAAERLAKFLADDKSKGWVYRDLRPQTQGDIELVLARLDQLERFTAGAGMQSIRRLIAVAATLDDDPDNAKLGEVIGVAQELQKGGVE